MAYAILSLELIFVKKKKKKIRNLIILFGVGLPIFKATVISTLIVLLTAMILSPSLNAMSTS
jgi:hypothetical protein